MDEAQETDDLGGASDATLVVAIGRWRQEALDAVYRRHAGAVFALAQKVLRNRALAEEAVQEVFLRLWRQPERFDADRGSLRSYLLAQCHGRSVDLLRSEASRRAREVREAASAMEISQDLAMQVEDLVVSEEVRKALLVLREPEREAIQLAYYGGYTYREVAHLLDEPEGTIKSRIRAGLERLRVALADAGIGDA